ncbi:MAG TPA: tRNA (adenosine(37)-N6)-threonylcarbamoyltransferase complex dimerization subunit type 1 TsaB [Kofleriaceae bacterium]|nr:tRNA (adenosine(37)-N6)-threonylcarbamoyltransferase complex dimerization subunit type 1 TsaB [Kofleriaceae bacterium]
MRLLAIDTATLTASAAVVDVDDDGRVHPVAAGELSTAAGAHGERLVPHLQALLDQAGTTLAAIDAFAVGAGPGSFTGLRIGLATAKGLAFATGRPLWLASSLAALAWDLAQACDDDAALLVPALDARRAEIYVGFYRRDGQAVAAVAPERVMPPAELPAALAALGAPGALAGPAGQVAIAGDALAVHAGALAALPDHVVRRPDVRMTPSAVGVAAVAAAGPRTDALAHGAPAYIRPSEAEVKYPDGVPGAVRRRS